MFIVNYYVNTHSSVTLARPALSQSSSPSPGEGGVPPSWVCPALRKRMACARLS